MKVIWRTRIVLDNGTLWTETLRMLNMYMCEETVFKASEVKENWVIEGMERMSVQLDGENNTESN